jgi:amidase
VAAALVDAAERLRDAGWQVEELDDVPPLQDACTTQIVLWMGDGYDAMVAAAQQEGDAGAIAALAGQAGLVGTAGAPDLSKALIRRATLARAWQEFTTRDPVLLMPASAELPFASDLDLQGPDAYARVWAAQAPMIGLPLTGLPSLVVSTGMVGTRPVGVQLVAGRFREDLLLAAGEAIEARGVPPMPVDPAA